MAALSEAPTLIGQLRRELLSCALCRERYSVPKVLPCLHSFCAHCLQAYIPAHSLSVTCPICRHQSILPREGVGALQDNRVIKELIAAITTGRHSHDEPFSAPPSLPSNFSANADNNTNSELAGKVDSSTQSSSYFLTCASHSGRALLIYCVDCDAPACVDCTEAPSGEHTAHRVVTLAEAVAMQRPGLSALLSLADTQLLPDMRAALSSVQLVSESLERNYVRAKDRIDATFNALEVVLRDRRSELLMEVDAVHAAKAQTLSEQMAAFEAVLSAMCVSVDYVTARLNVEISPGVEKVFGVDECLNSGGSKVEEDALECRDNNDQIPGGEAAAELLLLRREFVDRLSPLCDAAIHVQPEDNSEIQIDADVTLGEDVLRWIGQVRTNSAVAFETTANGDALRRCWVNRPAVIAIISRDRNGEPVTTGFASFTARIAPAVVDGNAVANGSSHDGSQSYSEMRRSSKDSSELGTLSSIEQATMTKSVSDYPRCKKVPGNKPEIPQSPRVRPAVRSTSRDRAVRKSVGDQPDKYTLLNENPGNRKSSSDHQLEILQLSAQERLEFSKSPHDTRKTRTSSDAKKPSRDSPRQSDARNVRSSLPENPEIRDNGDGTYEITYAVHGDPGLYSLEVCMYGQPIRGSPFQVKACRDTVSMEGLRGAGGSRVSVGSPASSALGKQCGGAGNSRQQSGSRSHGSNGRKGNLVEDDLILKIGAKGRNKGEFLNPQGVTCDGDRIVVADSNSQCIQVFSASTGDCLLRFGARGRQTGQLQRPTGVAVSAEGHYLVADYDNKWVSVFSSEGKYLNKLGTSKLLGPKGVCVDPQGRVIVVDNKASSVLVFHGVGGGRVEHRWGAAPPRGAAEPRHLAGPHFCAVGAGASEIIVSDFHNHCVKVFDVEGHFRHSFGSSGEGNGQFNAPTGVAVDGAGNIFVADWGNSRVQMFDRHGSFLSYVNTAADPLYGPQGVAVTPEGHVVVADSGNHCVKVYHHSAQ